MWFSSFFFAARETSKSKIETENVSEKKITVKNFKR